MSASHSSRAAPQSADAQFVHRWGERSVAWSPAVVDELDRWLHRVLRARLCLDREELDELVQETWLAALRSCPAPPPKAWFYVTAIRRQRHAAAQRARAGDALNDARDDMLDGTIDGTTHHEQSGAARAPSEFEPACCCERREFVDLARESLAALRGVERDLFVRHALAGQSLVGAARELGRTRKWARIAFGRAAERLRTNLGAWGQ